MSDKLMDDKKIIAKEKKLINAGQEGFVLEVRRMDKSQLQARLSEITEYKYQRKTEMEVNEEVQDADDKLKRLKKPFKDDIKGANEKEEFIALVLQEEA